MEKQYEQPGEILEQEKLLASLERIFQELPLCYKRFIVYGDWLMVLGGLKAGTDVFFVRDTYDEKEWEKLKNVFKREGLRFASILSKEKTPIKKLIYNPETLEQETANSDLVLPYETSENLAEWVERCDKAGKNREAILGKFFSFPESAVKDYIKKRKVGASKVHEKTGSSITSGGEIYWFDDNNPGLDVSERERKKTKFFEQLKHNPRFLAIINSEELKLSDAEWGRRLPDSIKKTYD